jgi:hypothetical protein
MVFVDMLKLNLLEGHFFIKVVILKVEIFLHFQKRLTNNIQEMWLFEHQMLLKSLL